MLREITATLRALTTVRVARPVATALTIVLAGALVAGCGIKGPLKPPVPAATTPSTPAAEKPANPDAKPAPAPAAEPAAPLKP